MIIDNRYNTASSIARKVNCTFSYANKSLKDTREAGLVKFINPDSGRREKCMMLTEKGTRAKDLLVKLYEVYNE